jgi:transcriptional regulator with XRE-family HTH domain
MHKGRKMLSIEEIRARLDDRILAVVAEKTGMHRNTVANIKSGKISNPTHYVLRKLSDYFEGVGK